MDNGQEAPENRFATLADLQGLLNTVRTEFARLGPTNNFEPHIPQNEGPNVDIQSLYQEVARLREVNTRREDTRQGHAEPKLNMPEKFDGTRPKLRGFVQQVKLFLRLHRCRYPDGTTQVAFVASLLSGNALSWVAPLIEKNSPLMDNLDAFMEALTSTFGDTDRERVAETRIQSLQQGLRSAATYAAEFQQLACDLDWNDKALINKFRWGLRDNVKDLLLTMPKVDMLDEFITQAIACDNRLFERRQEQRLGWRPIHQNMGATSSRVLPNRTSGPEPMQIDAMQLKRLTPEEKERRRKEDLCLYCGAPGHKVRDCQIKGSSFKTRSTTMESEQTGNENVQSQ